MSTAATGFFRSRWIDAPPHLIETRGGGLPQGFRAAGVACGIKEGGAPDLGLLVCDTQSTTSAAQPWMPRTISAVQLLPPTIACRSSQTRTPAPSNASATASARSRSTEA